MKKLLTVVGMSSLIALSGQAVAEEAKSIKQAKAAVEYREAIFELVKSNMIPLGGMARGKVPFDAQVMETNSERLAQLGAMISDYFQVDTRKFDVHTEAKPSIWDNKADFEQKIKDFELAAANLNKVAKARDEANYRAAIGKVGATCKSCHDDYKLD